MIKCLECGLCWIPLGGPGDQQIPDCPVCTLRERLVAAEAERDAARANRRVADEEARATMRDMERLCARLEAERAARVQAEAALSRARELLRRFVRILPRSLDMGRLPFSELHDEAAAFVTNPANTPKETT